jgi:NADH-quinone oxidoreductase subunit C
MMNSMKQMQDYLEQAFAAKFITLEIGAGEELSMVLSKENLKEVCLKLRDDNSLKFEQLMDLCGVDYLSYGLTEWATEEATSQGFSRARDNIIPGQTKLKPKARFAVVYHLLSITHNHRLRLKVFLSEEDIIIPSVTEIWASANWYEREAFDLFGILFAGHPDLRRILTDYGFIGHPFRKDFPLSGNVEVRYDASQGRVIYEPVSIEPRVLVPKVIRGGHVSRES